MIIALGESIVAIGAGAGEHIDAGVVLAAVLGIVVAAALWWLVLRRRRARLDAAAGRRRRRARSATAWRATRSPSCTSRWSPGIVLVALGMKKAIGHVEDPLHVVPTFALLGGAALYLLAHVAFRLRNVRTLNRRRLGLAIVLLALVPVADDAAAIVPLALLAAALSLLIAYETRDLRRGAPPRAASGRGLSAAAAACPPAAARLRAPAPGGSASVHLVALRRLILHKVLHSVRAPTQSADDPGVSATSSRARRRARVLLAAAALFARVFVALELDDNAGSGLTILYLLPVVLVGVELGRRAGIVAGRRRVRRCTSCGRRSRRSRSRRSAYVIARRRVGADRRRRRTSRRPHARRCRRGGGERAPLRAGRRHARHRELRRLLHPPQRRLGALPRLDARGADGETVPRLRPSRRSRAHRGRSRARAGRRRQRAASRTATARRTGAGARSSGTRGSTPSGS